MLSRELTAATAKPAILAILARGESYGYDILRQVKELTAGQVDWAEGAVYPVLHRLEDQGFIASQWRKAPETGRRRKYYCLTAAGRKEMSTEKDQWSLASALMEKLWGEPEPCLT